MVEWSLGGPLSELCPTIPPPTKMAAITKNRKFGKNHLKIIFSETAGPIGPKLWWNGL
jgi:hypothetical protein